jgi:hypothetical protein
MKTAISPWRLAFFPSVFLACAACGRTGQTPAPAAESESAKIPASVEARKAWLRDVEAAGVTGPPGALPPMLVVEKTEIGLKLHHFGDGPMCVRVARVEDGERCWFARAEECETLRNGESVDFVEPATDHAGGCPNGTLEFRVGKPLGSGTTWWTDSALEEFAANTQALEDGDIDGPPPWEDGGDAEAPRRGERRGENRVEYWRSQNARFEEAAKIREEARILAGEEDPMPTRESFARQLETLLRLEREKLWADLEFAGAIGEPGDMPPMFVVVDRRGTVTLKNITELSYSVMLKRSTNHIDPMRTYNPCRFNVESFQVRKGGGIEFSGFPESCDAGPLRFQIRSEDSQDPIEWWSRAAIEEYKEKSAFNAILTAREGSGPKPVNEIVWQIRHLPPLLNDTGRAERWRRAIEEFKGLRRAQ